MRSEQLKYFINEREQVRRGKEAGFLKPWSKDKTMQETYFCNIHREDDRVTKWIRKTYATVNSKMFDAEANMCMARLVNRIESLDLLHWPWAEFDEEAFKDVAGYLQPFWGNAYVVTTHGRKMGKAEYAVEVLGEAFKVLPVQGAAPTLRAYHRHLMQLEGFGSFMAAQVVADLKNTEGHILTDAVDWHIWSAPGPGSLRGLGWFFENKITPAKFEEGIAHAWSEVRDYVPDMCMQDFQNCLCEFDKYMRVSTGAGRSKRRYPGV